MALGPLPKKCLTMEKVDLSFFLEPPQLTEKGKLVIDALTPLSMTTTQPGTYYRSQSVPTKDMLYGMIENALGWHIGPSDRSDILKGLRKEAKKELGRGHPLKETDWITGDADKESEVGYTSLLQYHLKFVEPHIEPETIHFDDLWSRHVRGGGTSFPGGSRNYDYRLERVMNMEKAGELSFSDRSSYKIRDPEEIPNVSKGDKVHVNALRPQFPQYYVSPTPREYVIPQNSYVFSVKATQTVKKMVIEAFKDPASPPYLGTNDGWVQVQWEDLS